MLNFLIRMYKNVQAEESLNCYMGNAMKPLLRRTYMKKKKHLPSPWRVHLNEVFENPPVMNVFSKVDHESILKDINNYFGFGSSNEEVIEDSTTEIEKSNDVNFVDFEDKMAFASISEESPLIYMKS